MEGASTITQQLSKTLFLTPRKTLVRKIKEAILAFQLERRYTKDEILELYLNQVYFGSGAYGVESAAKIFFGKSVKRFKPGGMCTGSRYAEIAFTLFSSGKSGSGHQKAKYRIKANA